MANKQENKSDPLPEFLELTPERKAKIEEQQKDLRAKAIAHGRLTPEARRMQIAMAHETAALSDVQMLLSEGHKVQTSAPLCHALAKLASALAEQGRYDEASKRAPTDELKREYFRLWQAVWRDDKATCKCEPFDEGELLLTHDHVMQDVISQKHDHKLMPAIRCNHCGFVNVRPLTHELQQLEKIRKQASERLRGRKAEGLTVIDFDDLRDRKVLRK